MRHIDYTQSQDQNTPSSKHKVVAVRPLLPHKQAFDGRRAADTQRCDHIAARLNQSIDQSME